MFRGCRVAGSCSPLIVALTMLASMFGPACSTQALKLEANKTEPSGSECSRALAGGAVCESANRSALEVMRAGNLEAATAVQDVHTGALVAFAASPSSAAANQLDVTTPVLPLSLAKVFLFASWWDHNLPDQTFDCVRASPNTGSPPAIVKMSIHEMIVSGCDSAGRQMAIVLRNSIGAKAVLADMKRFGFAQNPGRDEAFWAELAPEWKARLVPAAARTSLSAGLNDKDWSDTLSIGETNMEVTVLHVSRFMQAAGNDGILLPPVARAEQASPSMDDRRKPSAQAGNAHRIMEVRTALRLQAALREVVQRGTAQGIADALEGTGWQIGGKTGTGPGPAPIGPQSDGWFAGLVFDPQGRPRYTVATFVRHGGRGGGNAAKVSAELARYLIENGGLAQ